MILGIDPGLANTGWAVVKNLIKEINGQGNSDNLEYELVDYGCFQTKIKDASAKRLDDIYKEVEVIIKKYKIEEIGVETMFFAKNAKSAIKVSEAIGVIKVCGRRNGLEVRELTPLQVKMALVGYGRAEKEQVEIMVRNFLGLEDLIRPTHASDAAAVALGCLFTNKCLEN